MGFSNANNRSSTINEPSIRVEYSFECSVEIVRFKPKEETKVEALLRGLISNFITRLSFIVYLKLDITCKFPRRTIEMFAKDFRTITNLRWGSFGADLG